MVPTSTRAHEHTSTRYPTYPAAEKPDHTRQHLPCRSTEIRHQHTPRCTSLPRRPAENASPHTTTQAPTVGSIIPAAHTKEGHAQPAAPQKPPRHEPARPNRRPLHPKHPMSPAYHRGRLHFEQPPGGFATIDPRHAGDTPQGSAYGSNSPQATNKNKPHHHNKHTKTSRTRPTQPPKGHAMLALPSNHAGGFATIDPRHAGDTPQRSAYGSNSPQATNKNKPHHHNKHTKTCRTRPTQPPKEHATLAHPSNHAGGFATIDPRHADDTPQGSAYGSNSPHRSQASTGAARSNRKPPQHAQHTRRGAAASAVAPLPGSQPETRVT